MEIIFDKGKMGDIPQLQLNVQHTDIFVATAQITKVGQALFTLPQEFVRKYNIKHRDKITLVFVKNDPK